YYSTRILFDPTVTVIESFESDPPLPINGVGLPPSSSVELANFEVRIPTLLNPTSGQIKLLLNASGHAITSQNNGPVDFSNGKADVVRAARSGGPGNVTADPFNGFMPDGEAPRVVGSTPTIIAAQPVSLNGHDEFVLPLVVFASEFCSQTPHPGDVLVQPGIFAEVTQTPAPVQDGQVMNVPVRLLLWPTVWDGSGLKGPMEWLTNAAGDASFLSAYDPLDDVDHQSCFVTVTPTPAGFPANPTDGLFTSSELTLRFSEPMDPASLTAFDSMTLTRKPIPPEEDPPLATSDFVVGALNQALDLQEFTFLPDLPLAHEASQIESYYLTLTTGKFAPTDLAGNPVGFALPPIVFNIDPTAAPQLNGGRVSRFTSQDEEPPLGDSETGPLPEWSGQHLYDLQREVIRPRPVVHFQIPADRSQAVPAMMTPFPQGVQTPLSSLGSKLQSLWRYVDFGFSLTDVTNYNIDIEGVYWAPVGGAVVSDSYAEFQISIAHCRWAPDEYIDPGSLFPKWSNSGLKPPFVNNFLNLNTDPAKIVHERFRGYQVNPGDLIVSPSSGTKLMPYPWNRNVGPEDWKTWTWRNTALRDRAGKNSGGVDPWILATALGNAPCAGFYMRQANVRTIGLPMLMEFRCYPDDGAVGANSFDISLAANSSAKPYFRAFSTGGINQSGNPVTIDPDIENTANGGFNPGSSPPGALTWGLDNTFYIGAADFVVRVSRSHSLWFPATNPLSEDGGLFSTPTYSPPILEPKAVDQPDGTSVTLAFRGMTKFKPTDDACSGTANNFEPIENALTLDNYGDHYDDKCLALGDGPNHNPNNENLGINFLNNDKWKKSIKAIN
ncbi:MAG: Ig-like domain-containing protein, partial [Planctomycetota bacterium]